MSEYIITLEQIKELVENAAVEAVDGYKWGVVKQMWSYPILPEIVRCRDCKHYMDYEHEYEPNLGYCREFDREEVRDSCFCAWGERRDS